MDETDFSEDKIYKQQEDFPHDEAISNVETRKDYDFTSKMDICDISNQIILTVDDPQDKTYGNVAMILDKITENTVNKKHDKQCTIILHIPPSKEMMSKSNISDILLNHLSKEEFFKGQGIDCETLPDISNADSFDDAIIKKIAFCYVKKSPPKEQISEHYDKLSPRKDDANSKPSSPAMVEDSVSDLEEPVVAGRSSIQGYSSFLTKAQGPGDQHQSFQGQAPQNQQTEKSSYSDGFKYGQGQVHYRLPDVSKVAPRVKISKNNTTNKSLTMESTERSHQNHLTGIDFETSLFGLSSTSQENSSSSSKIFEKISKGKQMCQKLREQTDQLKAKVLEKLQGHLELLEQEFLATKEKHLTLQQQQGPMDQSPAVSDFDPERKVGGESFKLEMLLEDVKEKIDERSDGGDSLHLDSGSGLRKNKCEHCSVEILTSRTVVSADLRKASTFHFHRQSYRFPPTLRWGWKSEILVVTASEASYSKPKRICPQRENFKSSQDEPEPRPKKDVAAFTTCSSDLTMPSPRSHSRRIYGNKTLSDFRNTDKMESEVLNSALDRALRTATILKETTDQMIKAIADDLAKAQKWRSRLKH
ncbi:protein AKNAD1 [Rhynchocyon petersi]